MSKFDIIEVLKDKLAPLFQKSGVILAYVFGSTVKGEIGPLSDIDIAVLFPEEEKMPMTKSCELNYYAAAELLGDENEKVEIGPLNNQALSFCYEVISTGICIYGREEDRVKYEVSILSQYLDFMYLARKYNQAFIENLLKEE